MVNLARFGHALSAGLAPLALVAVLASCDERLARDARAEAAPSPLDELAKADAASRKSGPAAAEGDGAAAPEAPSGDDAEDDGARIDPERDALDGAAPAPHAPSADAAVDDRGQPIPFFVSRASTGMFPSHSFDQRHKLGYVRRGAKLLVYPTPTPTPECPAGWFHLVTGGYVCSSHGTTDPGSATARFPTLQPDRTAVLPYTYLRNTGHGTPLFRSVPPKSEALRYEPYLAKQATKKPPTAPAAEGKKSEGASAKAEAKPDDAETSAEAASMPWWQQENIKEKLHEVTIEQLASEADEHLAMRLVRGFYVAKERSFDWNGRRWIKTTKGLITPQDRFGVARPSEFHGVELTGDWDLPVAWVYAREKAETYTLDFENKKITKRSEVLPRLAQVFLSGRELTLGGKDYSETLEGWWIRSPHVRKTDPGPAPEDLGPNERWVDVNLKAQTLVAYVGTQPVYATLLSSGRTNKTDPERDHSTPLGTWRIREKHVTSTMDGDGDATGELPYSIEEVPYVMFFHKAFALHGAFWHSNFGVKMSHGCVNLAPLDARRLFDITGPSVPEGWHGAWSTAENPGSRVIVHE